MISCPRGNSPPLSSFLLAVMLAVLAAIALSSPGCDDEDSEARDIARLEAMEEEIRELIGDAPCADSTDCAVIALGTKPCGGPWGYLVYARSAVDSLELIARVREYTAYNDELNRRWGWVSTCDLAPLPRVACVDGHCVDTLHLYDHGIPP